METFRPIFRERRRNPWGPWAPPPPAPVSAPPALAPETDRALWEAAHDPDTAAVSRAPEPRKVRAARAQAAYRPLAEVGDDLFLDDGVEIFPPGRTDQAAWISRRNVST